MNGFIPVLQKGNEEQPAPGEEGLFPLLKREVNALRSVRYGFLTLLKTDRGRSLYRFAGTQWINNLFSELHLERCFACIAFLIFFFLYF